MEEKIYLQNKNEYVIGDRWYVEKIDSCVCKLKSNSSMFICDIAGREEKEYTSDEGLEKLYYGPEFEQELWLSDGARETVKAAIEEYVKNAEEMKKDFVRVDIPKWGMTVFYKRKGELYDLVIEKKDSDGWEILASVNDQDLEHFIASMIILAKDEKTKNYLLPRTRRSVKNHPLYQAALREGDREFEIRLKMFYGADSREDCMWLQDLIGKRVLPKLSLFHNRGYMVEMTPEGLELLKCSGYRISDRSWLGGNERNYNHYYINPHEKTGVNGVIFEKPKPVISFEEYLGMFEGK